MQRYCTTHTSLIHIKRKTSHTPCTSTPKCTLPQRLILYTIDFSKLNKPPFSIKPPPLPLPKNFGWYIKWNEPFRFGPTGIFGTSFEGHFDRSGNFGRSDRNITLHLPKLFFSRTALLYSACFQEQLVVSNGK